MTGDTIRLPAPTRRIIQGNEELSFINPLPMVLVDVDGNPITSAVTPYGTVALDIHDADVHHQIVNKYINQLTATATVLTADVAADGSDYIISVADAAGFLAGDYLHINTSSLEATHPRIISIAGTAPATFTLDRRLDIAHLIGDTVTKTIIDMAQTGQVGTLANPQLYSVGPEPGEVWHLTRLLFEMTHGTAGDLGKFGDLAELINGVVLRGNFGDGQQYGTLTNWKRNGDIKTDMFDVEFDSRSTGGGSYGTSGRGTFKEAGAVVRLDGDDSDKVEVYIQDDLTALASFTMKFQGHLNAI